MSALLVDEMFFPLPTRPEATSWRHVEHGAQPQPHLSVVGESVGGEPVRVVREPVSAGQSVRPRAVGTPAPLRLTDRGIAVVVVFFLALVATAAIVLVTSFLGVSNDPISTPGTTPALVAGQA